MRKLCALVVILALISVPAHAAVGMEDFVTYDFGDFTMSIMDWWVAEIEDANPDQIFFFGDKVHAFSSGILMVFRNTTTGEDITAKDDLIDRYFRVLWDWGVEDWFYRDFYVDDDYCWFWSGTIHPKGGGTYESCGFITYRNQRDYVVLLVNEQSNSFTNSWRMNTMIDSIEWNDAA